MKTVLHPIRTIRDSIFQITSAVSASVEFSRSAIKRSDAETAIPL
jgi:hypothetical protein